MQTYHRCQTNRRRNGLPLETICDIFLFLPVENILAYNWTCLRLFRASQILYRPLQRPCQQRIIQQLGISITINNRNKPFVSSAQLQFRLLESGAVYVCKCSSKCEHNAAKSKSAIQRSYTDECWPNGPHLVQSLPAVGLPSDIVAIERINLSLSIDEQRRCYYNNEAGVSCAQELVSKMPFIFIFVLKLNCPIDIINSQS